MEEAEKTRRKSCTDRGQALHVGPHPDTLLAQALLCSLHLHQPEKDDPVALGQLAQQVPGQLEVYMVSGPLPVLALALAIDDTHNHHHAPEINHCIVATTISSIIRSSRTSKNSSISRNIFFYY